MRRWARRLGWSLLVLLAALVVATLVTARWGDAKLYPAPAGVPRVEVFVVSHGYHAGIVVPRGPMADVASAQGQAALVLLAGRFSDYRWLEIGWGDEGFYTSVPTIASLTVRSAGRWAAPRQRTPRRPTGSPPADGRGAEDDRRRTVGSYLTSHESTTGHD